MLRGRNKLAYPAAKTGSNKHKLVKTVFSFKSTCFVPIRHYNLAISVEMNADTKADLIHSKALLSLYFQEA